MLIGGVIPWNSRVIPGDEGDGHLPGPRELPSPASLPLSTCRLVWAGPPSCLLYREETSTGRAASHPRVATTEGPRLALRVLRLGAGAVFGPAVSCQPWTSDLFLGVRFYSWPTGPEMTLSLGQAAWQRWTGGPRGLLSQKQRLCFGRGASTHHYAPPEEWDAPSFPFVFSLAPFKALNPGSQEHVTEQVWGFCQDVVCGCCGFGGEMCLWDSWIGYLWPWESGHGRIRRQGFRAD